MTASVDPEVEAALVSDRMARVERRLGELEVQARESNGHLARLVQLAEADDARKQEALRIEAARRLASEEAEAKLVADKIEGRRWWRATGLPQIIGVVVTIGGAIGTAITAWATGLVGGDR